MDKMSKEINKLYELSLKLEAEMAKVMARSKMKLAETQKAA